MRLDGITPDTDTDIDISNLSLSTTTATTTTTSSSSSVSGDVSLNASDIQVYTREELLDFFSKFKGINCRKVEKRR
jgi:hypothetical protein